MSASLYVRIRGKVHGPFDAEKLKRLAAGGKITRDDEVSRDQLKWVPAANVKGLFPPAELVIEREPIPTIVPPIAAPAPLQPPPVQPQMAYVQAPAPSVSQSVVVNVNQYGNTCAMIAAGMSLLALAFCWLPFLGLLTIPLAAIAIILAGVGFVISLTRKGKGVVASIAAGIVGSIAIIVSIISTGAAIETGNQALLAATQSADRSMPPASAFAPAALPSTTAPQESPAENDPGPPSDPLGPRQLGDVRITVTTARIGKVPLQSLFNGKGDSTDEQMMITIKIENTSQTKKINYRTFDPDFSIGDDMAVARDNHDNIYKRVDFGTAKPAGKNEDVSIYPGKSIEDVLVFEVPIDGVEFVKLDLPGRPVGESGEISFWILPSEIVRSR